jgi:transposase
MTARVARAAFPHGHLYLGLADELGSLFTDELFHACFSPRGQPAFAPWRLALATILQFAENLSDRQAADAVRSRIDWKYVLRLDLSDPGFDHTVLCEFRTRLVVHGAERLLFDTLLTWCRERQFLKARGRQRSDSTHVLAAVQALNRLELVAETFRATLNSLATVAPTWLQQHAPAEWIQRYQRRFEDDRLPRKQPERLTLATIIGADGAHMLTLLAAPETPAWLREIPTIVRFYRIWLQNYRPTATGLQWRTAEDGRPPASQFVSSPYDPDAHFARKRTTQWIGYKVHLTETCDDDQPHVITHVETTTAPIADGTMTPHIHAALQTRDLLPDVHLVDTGYLDAELLASSHQHFGVDLVGPTRPNVKGAVQEQAGFGLRDFQIDWAQQAVTCPAGKLASSWTTALDARLTPVIKIKFSRKACSGCPHRAACVQSDKPRVRRTLTIRTQEAHEALQAGRDREQTQAYKHLAAKRAGIEGTISQAVRRCGMRRTRYIGLPKTHLQHLLMATAVNAVRIGEWLAGTPHAKTRIAPFVQVLRQAP